MMILSFTDLIITKLSTWTFGDVMSAGSFGDAMSA